MCNNKKIGTMIMRLIDDRIMYITSLFKVGEHIRDVQRMYRGYRIREVSRELLLNAASADVEE